MSRIGAGPVSLMEGHVVDCQRGRVVAQVNRVGIGLARADTRVGVVVHLARAPAGLGGDRPEQAVHKNANSHQCVASLHRAVPFGAASVADMITPSYGHLLPIKNNYSTRDASGTI